MGGQLLTSPPRASTPFVKPLDTFLGAEADQQLQKEIQAPQEDNFLSSHLFKPRGGESPADTHPKNWGQKGKIRHFKFSLTFGGNQRDLRDQNGKGGGLGGPITPPPWKQSSGQGYRDGGCLGAGQAETDSMGKGGTVGPRGRQGGGGPPSLLSRCYRDLPGRSLGRRGAIERLAG